MLTSPLPDGRVPVLLSAHDEELIGQDARAILDYLGRAAADTDTAAVASTLLRLRRVRRHRAVVRAADATELASGLVALARGEEHPLVTPADPEIRELSMETLEKAIAEVGAAAEEKIRIRLHVIEQEPAQALIEAAKGADLLVVGSRGHGGLTSMRLGSVSQRCIHHGPCPVVVVHGHEG